MERLLVGGFVLIALGAINLMRSPGSGLSWYDTGAIVVGVIMVAIGGIAAYRDRDR